MRLRAAVMVLCTAVTAARADPVCDANLMIVLDRSCSMQERPGGRGTPTKWQIAQETLAMLTTTFGNRLRFGLILFPDRTGGRQGYCVQDGPIPVNVGPNRGDQIVAAIANTTPSGPCVTDIDAAMGQVSRDPEYAATSPQPGRRSYVLLLTDGEQSDSCGGPAARDPITVQAIEALYAHGYPTYIVGFGGEVSTTSLDSFAAAGGVPRVGMPRYYQADTAADLLAVLQGIAGNIAGDEFSCRGTPCPDGRCFGAGEVCSDGACTTPGTGSGGSGGTSGLGAGGRASPGPGSDGAAQAGMGDPVGGHAMGQPACACRVTARGESNPGAMVVLLIVAAAAAGRRHPRSCLRKPSATARSGGIRSPSAQGSSASRQPMRR
jgi:hypothetical protein